MIKQIKSFDSLKHGDKIISPIDNEVVEFLIANDGSKYLASKSSAYDYCQFDPTDFYIYTGSKEAGETDADFFTPQFISEMIFSKQEHLCCVCGKPTHYVEINYEVPFCSDECVREMDEQSCKKEKM